MIDAAIWTFAPLVTLLALAGIGANLVPARADHDAPSPSPAAAIIVGLLIVATTVTLWNLVLPLGTRPAGITLLAGIVGLVVALRRRSLTTHGLADVMLTSLVATVLYRITSPVIPIRFFTDTIGYHLSHMEWIAREPMPIGSAILQTRLGYNPGFMTLVSALRWEPLGQTHLFTAEVAIRALFLLVTLEILRATAQRDPRLRDTVLAIVLVSLPFFAINKSGTDGNIGFVLLILAVLALAAAREADDRERTRLIVLLIGLVGLAISFKLSAATAVLLLIPALRRSLRAASLALLVSRPHRPLLALPVLLLVGWTIRGVATTGCLAFPLGLSCAPVSWGVGAEDAAYVSGHITEFARRSGYGDSGAALLDLTWVPTWIATYLTSVPALIVLVALPVAVIGRRRRIASSRARTITMVTLASLPAALIALSVADLLGGRRFLGVDPAVVAILDDYPRLAVILLLPLLGLALALTVASLAPRRHPVHAAPSTSGREPPGHDPDPLPIRVLGPFLTVSFLYWFLVAPAVRFAWAPHVLVAALLLTGWIASVDLDRLRIERSWSVPAASRSARMIVTIGSLTVLLTMGILDPSAPLSAPEPSVIQRTVLEPSALEVLRPEAPGACSVAFPCDPGGAEGIAADRRLGRTVFHRTGDQRERLRRELEIVPSSP